MDKKLPPVARGWFEENRERFNAETTIFDPTKVSPKCKHFIIRISSNECQCKICRVGWYDSGRFVLEKGQIVSIK